VSVLMQTEGKIEVMGKRNYCLNAHLIWCLPFYDLKIVLRDTNQINYAHKRDQISTPFGGTKKIKKAGEKEAESEFFGCTNEKP